MIYLEERKYYPLNESQKVMFLNLSFSYKKAIVNICAAVDLFSEIDPDVMLKAMKTSLRRNKSAGYRITKRDKQIVQYCVENEEPEHINLVDLSDKNDVHREKIYNKWSSTPFPNGTKDTQPYRLNLVKKDNGFYTIYLCVSHIFFDAYAVMRMLNDVFAVYHAMLKDEPLPECNIDSLPAYEIDYKYGETDKYKRDYKYWDETVLGTEPHLTTIGGLGSSEFKKGKNSGTTLRLWQIKGNQINLPMKKELVDKINTYALERNMSPQNLFYLAIRTYLSKVCGNQEDVAIMDNLARRGSLVQKNGGGTLVNVVMLRTQIPNTTTFEEGCSIFNKTCREAYRHGNMPYAHVINMYSQKYQVGPMDGYTAFSTTYQPVIGVDTGDIKYSFRRLSNGASTLPVYLTIMPKDNFSGELLFNYEYSTGFTKEENIYKVHEFITEFLTKAMENPKATLEELMK